MGGETVVQAQGGARSSAATTTRAAADEELADIVDVWAQVVCAVLRHRQRPPSDVALRLQVKVSPPLTSLGTSTIFLSFFRASASL